MHALVQATRVANNLPTRGSPPQRGRRRRAVAARRSLQLGRGHACLGRLDNRPVDAVRLVVEAAGVAEVVPGRVPPPQGGGAHAAVDARVPSLGLGGLLPALQLREEVVVGGRGAQGASGRGRGAAPAA